MLQPLVHSKVTGAPSKAWVQNVLRVLWVHLPSRLKGARRCAILFVGERRSQTLNKQYRGKDRPTDVLAFPGDKDSLGDIVICVPQVRRQAHRFKISEKEEMARVLVHGVLHLLGYQHDVKARANTMFALQEKVVTSLEE